MKQFPQARLMTRRPLFIVALCTHLFIAGVAACAQARETASTLADRSERLTASPSRDCLVARPSSTTLSLHQSQRRSEPFAAAISSSLVALRVKGKLAHPADLPAARAYASLLPAASRAPPSLVV